MSFILNCLLATLAAAGIWFKFGFEVGYAVFAALMLLTEINHKRK